MKCKKSKPTRLCALKYFCDVDEKDIIKIVDNKYNTIAKVKNSYYLVITDSRYNIIRRRISYPDRFNDNSSNYRAKIITGYTDAEEHRFKIRTKSKCFIFYIYKLPIKSIDEILDYNQVELLDRILDQLKDNENLRNQFMYKLKEILKDEFIEEFNRGYDSGYSDGVLVSQ